ncbi:enoyl-CoA hydratase [Labrys miyagiensis]|uniref:Enoyl-CoA hydratase n=1 Tax=Labrys miyagiensis TaxID=346912 RepID=A0ABQ6CSK4_9HYPH|nr:enoyl-CoA hydratase [Labrys miyagiensis]GLS23356.1 enoyl-CoA hydratase [Labrys miyagiensis]
MPGESLETLLVERRGRVGLITLNRPKALNALNATLATELTGVLAEFDADEAIGCSVITGSEKAFAAGADVKEMAGKAYPQALLEDFIAVWDGFARLRKPVIAAVSGFALGGGCELAMLCDLIIASDSAKFGQPEIRLGVVPGIGGTQRLVRAIGKAKAMEMVLTGRMMEAAEAEQAGLVARVVPAADLLAEALKTAETIAAMPLPAVIAAKDCVDRAYELTLAEGVRYERRAFYALFASEDQKEGMAAFIEKRPPVFKHR